MSQTSGSERMDFCDYCSRNFPETELEIIYTVMNGIEQKERVCPDCEAEAREYEKPPARTDGGTDGSERISHPLVVDRAEFDQEPFVVVEIGQYHNSKVTIDAGEGYSEYTVSAYLYDPDDIKKLADKLQQEAEWLERELHTGSEQSGGGGR